MTACLAPAFFVSGHPYFSSCHGCPLSARLRPAVRAGSWQSTEGCPYPEDRLGPGRSRLGHRAGSPLHHHPTSRCPGKGCWYGTWYARLPSRPSSGLGRLRCQGRCRHRSRRPLSSEIEWDAAWDAALVCRASLRDPGRRKPPGGRGLVGPDPQPVARPAALAPHRPLRARRLASTTAPRGRKVAPSAVSRMSPCARAPLATLTGALRVGNAPSRLVWPLGPGPDPARGWARRHLTPPALSADRCGCASIAHTGGTLHVPRRAGRAGSTARPSSPREDRGVRDRGGRRAGVVVQWNRTEPAPPPLPRALTCEWPHLQ